MGRSTATSVCDKSYVHRGDPMQSMPMQFGMQADDERIILLTGDVNESSIAMATAAMLSMSARDRHRPIQLVINTYGGSIDEMFCMYDVMRYIKTPVHTVGLGKVMSAGVLLLAAGTKGKRLLGQNARIMMHAISSGTHGNIFEILSHVDELDRMQKRYEKCLVAETNMVDDQILAIMKNSNDTYISSEKAIECGIADRLAC